jgi:hypothetical protein
VRAQSVILTSAVLPRQVVSVADELPSGLPLVRRDEVHAWMSQHRWTRSGVWWWSIGPWNAKAAASNEINDLVVVQFATPLQLHAVHGHGLPCERHMPRCCRLCFHSLLVLSLLVVPIQPVLQIRVELAVLPCIRQALYCICWVV